MTTLSRHPFRTAPRLSKYSSTLLMLLTGLFALWVGILHGSVPYTPDSASYIEQARSLLAGNGFTSRPYWIDDIDVLQRPDKWFPPGYPLVIAAGSAVSGAPVEAVALWINRLALIALPLIIFVAFRPVIGLYGAVCLGILGGLSPGVAMWGQFVHADVFSLTLVVTSFGFTLAAWSLHPLSRALLLAFGGGLVAGFAYLTRNAHLALLLAMPLSMGIWFLVSPPMERFRTWRVGLSWVLGAALIVLPWLARNVMIFGQIQPYEMPPSTVSGWWNLRIFIRAQIAEVFGSPYLGALVGWSIPGLLTLLLMLVVEVRLSSKYWSILQSEERRALLFSLIYALLGAAIIIAARTKYQWGEPISERHTLQYALFLLLPAAILLRHLSGSRVGLIALTVAIMVTLATLRFLAIANQVNQENQKTLNTSVGPRDQLEVLSNVVRLIEDSSLEKIGPCARDHRPLVISNYAYFYRILCDANSRHIEVGSMAGRSIAEAASLIESSVGNRPVLVVFHPGRGIESSNMPLRDRDVEALEAQGWTIRENSLLALVIARN